jgi:hypothetical protein
MFLYINQNNLIHQELKVNRSKTALAIVNDVLGPDFAFDVDKNAGCNKKTKCGFNCDFQSTKINNLTRNIPSGFWN